MRFVAAAPAPLSATPTTPPEIATEPEMTMASIVAVSLAVIVSAPAASMLESSTYARTCAAAAVTSTRCHSDVMP